MTRDRKRHPRQRAPVVRSPPPSPNVVEDATGFYVRVPITPEQAQIVREAVDALADLIGAGMRLDSARRKAGLVRRK